MVDARKIGGNFILVMILVFALIGLFFLVNLGIPAGVSYLFLAFLGLTFLLIVVVFKFVLKRDFWFEIPISTNPERGVLMLILGIFILGLIFGISSMSGLNFYSPFLIAPLGFKGLITTGAETFAALQAVTSPFGQFFVTVITASVIEEVVLGFAFVLMGSLVLGLGLRKAFSIDLGDKGNEIFDFIGAMVFSIILFAALHIFNGSYINPDGTLNMSLFTFAAVFRLVLNILMYKFGNFGLLFAIGVHAVNNAIFLGSETVFAALASFPGGVIFDAVLIIIIVFALTSIKKIVQEGELVAKDFITFDWEVSKNGKRNNGRNI